MACYAVSLSGCDDELGDANESGWCGLIRGPLKLDGSCVDLVPEDLADLDDDDRRTLATMSGAVVYEDSQGFVDVETFDTADELEQRWAYLQEENLADAQRQEG